VIHKDKKFENQDFLVSNDFGASTFLLVAIMSSIDLAIYFICYLSVDLVNALQRKLRACL